MIDINPILPGAGSTWPPTTDYKAITNIKQATHLTPYHINCHAHHCLTSLKNYPKYILGFLSKVRSVRNDQVGNRNLSTSHKYPKLSSQYLGTIYSSAVLNSVWGKICVFLAKGKDTTGDMEPNQLKFKFKTTMNIVSSPFLEKIFAYFCIFFLKWSSLWQHIPSHQQVGLVTSVHHGPHSSWPSYQTCSHHLWLQAP